MRDQLRRQRAVLDALEAEALRRAPARRRRDAQRQQRAATRPSGPRPPARRSCVTAPTVAPARAELERDVVARDDGGDRRRSRAAGARRPTGRTGARRSARGRRRARSPCRSPRAAGRRAAGPPRPPSPAPRLGGAGGRRRGARPPGTARKPSGASQRRAASRAPRATSPPQASGSGSAASAPPAAARGRGAAAAGPGVVVVRPSGTRRSAPAERRALDARGPGRAGAGRRARLGLVEHARASRRSA